MEDKISFKQKLKNVPWYGWLAGVLSLLIQSVFYYASNFIATLISSPQYSTKIDIIDNNIPLVPIFAIVYIYSYIFWFCAPIAASIADKEQFKKFIIGQFIAYFIGFIIYIFAPTIMNRETEGILKTASENNWWLLSLIYKLDGGKIAFNLCPSYHCLTSTYCYLAVRKQKKISVFYKIYSFVLAILICLATLFIKQHYFLDLVFGVSISILTYIFVNIVYALSKKQEQKNIRKIIFSKISR